MHVARWRLHVLATALLLLGGSLAVGGLSLPWWHVTQPDGSPFPNPADNLTYTPGVGWYADDVIGHLLLLCPVVAVAGGLVALLPSVRPSEWLKALLAPLVLLVAAMGLMGLVVVFLYAWRSELLIDCNCEVVRDVGPYLSGLGYALILVGDVLVGGALGDATTPSAMRR
jgi:hypothetical protein